MPRPPLVLGTWGKISRTKRGATWVASARFRDFDGVTRKVERQGASGRQAEDALVEHLRDRTRMHGGELTGDSRVRDLAEQWASALEQRQLAESTLEAYRRSLRVHILPALGDVRIRECTVPLVDRFLAAVRATNGDAAAKRARVVLTGAMSLAVRHGAAPTNPVRETETVRAARQDILVVDMEDVPLMRKRVAEWDRGTDKGGRGRVTDLADIVDMFLATGARTGEVLALRWTDLDLGADLPTVTIRSTVVQITGQGLRRQERPKSDSSHRTLGLPSFAVAMLLRRRTESQGEWVFPSSTGTLRAPNNMRRQWRDFREHWDYPTWITPKTFRKAVATVLDREDGIDVAAAQLGHSSNAVTKKHYAAKAKVGPDVRTILDRFAEAVESGM
ncbi:tyrosine recombinase XerC [Curtobacterium sp. MCBD17_028]|uniref:site-specific integrase n=1 Tax=Curtobacterium sp. MCBD17_028 TaxID=2175670 RepID=UPI000DA96881|nr:tyrosine-type recombinase/integrase [Curtobacterium sp. MCBD17_028]PZE23896.1 site-specific integrase [Curtobacterium sp. MCBD17_028]